MRFDYTGIISSAADTGDPAVIFRPEIEITIHGPKGSREVLALVDTGSDDTVLSERVARDLGIPLRAERDRPPASSAAKSLNCSTPTWSWNSFMPTVVCAGWPMSISWPAVRTRPASYSDTRAFRVFHRKIRRRRVRPRPGAECVFAADRG